MDFELLGHPPVLLQDALDGSIQPLIDLRRNKVHIKITLAWTR